jgi:putative serine protease PepD
MRTKGTNFVRLSTATLLASAIVAAPIAAILVTGAGDATATTATADPGLALQADFVRAVATVRASVVEISTPNSLGSGVLYDNKGDIVTNAHVVGSDTSFTVSFSNGKTVPGRLVGTYVPDDIAVISVAATKGLTPARFGNSSSLQVGEIVLAIGNPLGLSSSVTDGIVSFNGRAVSEGNGVVLPDLIQTSAAINPGNSGGALVNLSGRVVGIPTLAATNGDAAAPGLGFAIPSRTVALIAPQLIGKGAVTAAGRAALGISATDAFSLGGERIGVLVKAAQDNGPADKAGITPGELITAVNGSPTKQVTELQTVLARLKPGAQVAVSVTGASGQERSVQVVLTDLAQF